MDAGAVCSGLVRELVGGGAGVALVGGELARHGDLGVWGLTGLDAPLSTRRLGLMLLSLQTHTARSVRSL